MLHNNTTAIIFRLNRLKLPSVSLQSLIWQLHPYIRFKQYSTALFTPVLTGTGTIPSRIFRKSDRCYILTNVKTHTSNFFVILVNTLYKTLQRTASLTSNNLDHGLHAGRQSIPWSIFIPIAWCHVITAMLAARRNRLRGLMAEIEFTTEIRW